MAISFLENGCYIEEKGESIDTSVDGGKRKKISTVSVLKFFPLTIGLICLVILMQYHY